MPTPSINKPVVSVMGDIRRSVKTPKDTVKYSDINRHPVDPKNNLYINARAINQALINLFTTSEGERFLLPEFGFNLEDLLFEVVSDSIALSIMSLVDSKIKRWEPRVTLDTKHSYVKAKPDEHCYDIKWVFNIPADMDLGLDELNEGSITITDTLYQIMDS